MFLLSNLSRHIPSNRELQIIPTLNYREYASTKTKLGVVKSYQDYNAPNFCNLQVPINRNTDAVLFSCDLLYNAIHVDCLPTR